MTYSVCQICANAYVFALILLIPAYINGINTTAVLPKVKVISTSFGDKIVMKCQVETYSNTTVCWYRNNNLFANCTKLNEGCKKMNKKHIEIKEKDFEINDNFTCVAENVYGKANDSHTITCADVLPKVNVKSLGSGFGDEIVMKCQVETYSNTTVCWYWNNNLYGNCTKLNEGCKKMNIEHIKIKEKDLEINDNFTCVAENVNGKANDSHIISCSHGGCLEWESSSQENITINVGQHLTIACELISIDNWHINECFQFGIRHHNQSSIRLASVYEKSWIRYWYDIINAHVNDTGVYTCYYNKKFSEEMDCVHKIDKMFNVVVREIQSGDRSKKTKIAIAVSLVAVLVVGLILVASIFCLRNKKLKAQRLYESNPEIRWDVFVSYSSKDFEWVKELCETLEQPPFNRTVCLHQRDWEVGRTILDNMAESVYCSYKTLLIVSKSYLESSFCVQELNMALDCERSTHKLLKERVILIKLDDVSLKNLPKTLRQKSYLDFSNNEQRKHYKTKLLKALLPRPELDEHLGNEQQSDESWNEEWSEEFENEMQSEETSREKQSSNESGNEAQSEISGNKALFEDAKNMECVQLHYIENERTRISV